MSVERRFATEPASALGAQAEREHASGLAAKARKGTHAILATRLLSIVYTLVSITVLSRLIPPHDFGVWATATLPLGVLAILREFGMVASLIQAKTLSAEQKNAYFWISVGLSFSSAAVLALVAPLLAAIYDVQILEQVVRVSCLALVFGGLGVVHNALLRRDLEFPKIAVIEGGGMLCSLAVGITIAYLWRDVWALVFAQVAQTAWISASSWILCKWLPKRPALALSVANLRFSLEVTLYNVLTYASNNIGLAAGYRFSPADLGFFNRGRMLCHTAQYTFLTPITEVGFGLLCRLKTEGSYRAAYIALARRVAVLFIPAAAVLPIVSADLVLALLGPNWIPAGPIVAWFAPVILGQACAAVVAQLISSQGRGAELRTCAVFDLGARGTGAVIGSHFGIVGLAAGFSLATFFLSMPFILRIAGRSGPVKLRDQAIAIWPGLLLGAAAAAGAGASVFVADALHMAGGWHKLAFVGGSAALAWTGACLALRPARDALLGKALHD